jgi:peptidoglycan/LPS O-acetylase OafA/YrhL
VTTDIVLVDGPASSEPPAPETQALPKLSYVGALDGIRAAAVLGVLAYHGGVTFLSGGFLGVDTFFVLSGFLITTLLLEEWTATATIRLRAFWARRARRLLPALLLVLVFVAFYAHFALGPDGANSLRADGIATLAYVSNWHFIIDGANYFTATSAPSPLTHTWSLAVEEQFYLVWPLVVLGVLRWRKKLGALLAVAVGGVVVSTTAMVVLFERGASPTRLYYGTDTHGQCIMVGASLAIAMALATQRRMRAGSPSRPVAATRVSRVALSVLGVACVALSAAMWAKASLFGFSLYTGGFLVAALATAGVLLSILMVPRSALAWFLSLAPLRFVGRISYGLYLWHFPIFLWVNATRTGLAGWQLFVVDCAIAFAAASASFYLVERPIRSRSLVTTRAALAVVPLSVALTAVVILAATVPVDDGAALAATPGSSLAPSAGAKVPSTHVRMLVVGDSMAETLANGMQGATAARFGVTIDNQATPNCSLAMGPFRVLGFGQRDSAPPCQPGSGDPGWPVDWAKSVRTFHPQVSVILNRLDVMDRLYDGKWTHIGDAAYDTYLSAQMVKAVKVLSAAGGKVVFLTSPYYSSGVQPNGAPWPEDQPARVDRYNVMMRQVAAQFPGVAFVVDLNTLVSPGGRFTGVVDGTQIRFADGVHWTVAGDQWLAPRLLPAVVQIATGSSGGGTVVRLTAGNQKR